MGSRRVLSGSEDVHGDLKALTQISHRLVGREENAAGQIDDEAGRFELCHDRSFDIGKVQSDPDAIQVLIDSFEHLESRDVDEVDRAAHE